MTHRERVLMALGHQEPDRVPIDLGGMTATAIMVGPYRRLCERLGLDVEPIHVMDAMGQCPLVSERLRQALDTDAVGICQLPKSWHVGKAYDGSEVLYPRGFEPELDRAGAQVVRTPSGEIDSIMPPGVLYFEPVRHPLQHISSIAEIDKALEDIAAFDRPPWLDLGWDQLAMKAREVRETTDAIVLGEFGGHIFQAAQILRGWQEFMVDLVQDPSLAEALMNRLAEAQIAAFEQYSQTVGKYVDIVVVCDDLGTQSAPFISREMYRRLIKPYHAKLYQYIKGNFSGRLFLHSDGSIYPLIPDLIEIGVDILNPIQFTAKGMDAARLKREFGNDICLWGAGVDTQHVLPFGTPNDVAVDVERRINEVADGGGFVFAAVHNIQEGVPTENILALLRAAHEYGRY